LSYTPFYSEAEAGYLYAAAIAATYGSISCNFHHGWAFLSDGDCYDGYMVAALAYVSSHYRLILVNLFTADQGREFSWSEVLQRHS